MSLASIFEDFSDSASASTRQSGTTADPLEGYESGYQSGWDDAVKAHLESHTHLSSTLSQNLEQVEFTMIEAQSQLLSNIRPILEEISNTLLPGLGSQGLRSLIVNEVETLLKSNVARDISIVVSEHDEATVSAFLHSSRNLSEISLEAKETLAEGQAYVSCAAIQRKIDVGQALSEIQLTIESYLNQPELEQANAR